ncbi:hypothetical protein G6F64_015152 [Rhizopus arrhizus]|uniref:HpcH/HpaI aldolase/citrate lyase domain-containing protein n=1 Tax=Rhizopus oryzae TaxID=64495 RepID=A0A9P7BIX8_RHIOR|nr:hypothetical protein G6F64_015152 [Rhizopus arrhizus]
MTESRFPLDGRLPDMLRSGKPLRGLFNGLPSPAFVEMCAYAGFDFIILDNEHGSADLGVTEHMLRAARAAGIASVVRAHGGKRRAGASAGVPGPLSTLGAQG